MQMSHYVRMQHEYNRKMQPAGCIRSYCVRMLHTIVRWLHTIVCWLHITIVYRGCTIVCGLHTIVCMLHAGCIRSYAGGRRWKTHVPVVIYEYL